MAKHFGTGRFTVQPNVSRNDSFLSKQNSAASNAFDTQDASLQSNRLRWTSDLYFDPKPVIVRRPTLGEPVVYEQNIFLRFLQPPAIPPPGVMETILRAAVIPLDFFYSHSLSKKLDQRNHLRLHL